MWPSAHSPMIRDTGTRSLKQCPMSPDGYRSLMGLAQSDVSRLGLINGGIASVVVRFYLTNIVRVQDIVHLQLNCTIVINFNNFVWSLVQGSTTLRGPIIFDQDTLVQLMRMRSALAVFVWIISVCLSSLLAGLDTFPICCVCNIENRVAPKCQFHWCGPSGCVDCTADSA